MKFKIRLVVLLPLLLVCPGSGLHAAADADHRTFRAVAWNRQIPAVHFRSDQGQRTFDLHRGIVSPEQRCDAGEPLSLWLEPPAAEGEPAPPRVPIATVRLRPVPADNLVLLWVDKQERHQAIVVPNEPESLPAGHARFINVTRHQLSINCNGVTLMLDPGTTQLVPGDGRGVRLKVAINRNRQGHWELAAMNAVRVRPDTRVSVFIGDPDAMAEPLENRGREMVRSELDLLVIVDRVVVDKPTP